MNRTRSSITLRVRPVDTLEPSSGRERHTVQGERGKVASAKMAREDQDHALAGLISTSRKRHVGGHQLVASQKTQNRHSLNTDISEVYGLKK